jgi:predicted dehydrogenase
MTSGPVDIPVVVVGFGRMGRLHARTFDSLPGFRIVGVVDSDESTAPVAAAMGFEFFRSLDEVRMARLAVIAVPSSLHAAVFSAAAGRGMDCLIEKPVGTHLRELSAMSALALAAGVQVFAGYSERFNPAMPAIQAALRSGPCSIGIRRLSSIALQREADSDVMFDLLLHDVDWLMHAMDAEPIGTQIRGRRFHAGKLEEISCELQFPGDIQVRTMASRICTSPERSVGIVGSDGRRWDFNLDAPRPVGGDDALAAQARALGAALRGEPSMIAHIGDALRVQQLLHRLNGDLQWERQSAQVLNVG